MPSSSEISASLGTWGQKLVHADRVGAPLLGVVFGDDHLPLYFDIVAPS